MTTGLNTDQLTGLLREVEADLRGKGVEVSGLVIVGFGPGADGSLNSKVATVVDDTAQIPFAYAYASVLAAAAALPPVLMPGMDQKSGPA